MSQPTFQIKKEEAKANYGRFLIEPLERGYGHTLGVTLRRVLLTSLPGAAITQVKIAGLKHQFGVIKGVREDGVDLLLNLKKVRFAYGGEKPIRAVLAASGKGTVTAGEIKAPAQAKVINPDLTLATVADSQTKLEIEMQVEAGVGYSPAEERKTETVGVIPLDADFSPVKRVNYRVEETRVGRLTNYDKLTLEIWTDGTMTAEVALKKSAEILRGFLDQLISPVKPREAKKPAELISPVLGSLSVEELGLPTRIANALTKAGYETVADIASKKDKLTSVRNLGAKSIKIVQTALGEKGVSLGD